MFVVGSGLISLCAERAEFSFSFIGSFCESEIESVGEPHYFLVTHNRNKIIKF